MRVSALQILVTGTLICLSIGITSSNWAHGKSLLDSDQHKNTGERKPSEIVILNSPHAMTRFGLTTDFDVTDMVQQQLRQMGLADNYHLVESETPSHPKETKAKDYTFSYGEVPVCKLRIRTFTSITGKISILGTIPTAEPARDSISWPSRQAAMTTMINQLEEHQRLSSTITKSKPCWYVHEGTLIPTWEFTFGNTRFSAIGIADDWQLYSAESRSFDVDGIAVIYPRDHTQQEAPRSYLLKNLKSDTNYLENDFFTTDYENATAAGISRALPTEIPTRTYDYSQDIWQTVPYGDGLHVKDHMAEVTAFTNANRVLQFFQNLGYSETFSRPMAIVMNYGVNAGSIENINNAAYTVDAYGRAQLVFGDGDGTLLKHIPLSLDVMAHEFSHHIIFQTVWATTGESAQIHEGLADFFTNMITNDSCLAPSTCGDACFTSQCLRNSENQFAAFEPMNGLAWRDAPMHLRSQVLSGLLWSIQASGTVNQTTLTQLVFEALKYLPPDASFKQLFAGITLADVNLFEGQNACAIIEGAEYRNLIYPGAVECDGSNSSTILEKDLTSGGSIGSPTNTSSDSSSSFWGCGTIESNRESHQSLLLLFMSIPLLLGALRERKKANEIR